MILAVFAFNLFLRVLGFFQKVITMFRQWWDILCAFVDLVWWGPPGKSVKARMLYTMLRRRQMVTAGSKVRLHTPDNPKLHKQEAVVKEVTDYGAVVSTQAAATGQYRAMLTEMVVVEDNHRAAISKGYSGDMCSECGGARMKRNGSCLLCEDCGATSGCS